MKKIYQQPETLVMQVLSMPILSGSIEFDGNVTDADVFDPENPDDNEGDARSDMDWDIWQDPSASDNYWE